MELLHNLLKSGLVLGLFYTIYGLLLKKETHFQWYRVFLIIGILLSFGLPFLMFTKKVYLAITETEQVNPLIKPIINSGVNTIDWLFFIGIIYFLGLLIMSTRFIHQCYSLYKIISKSAVEVFENQQYLDTSVRCTPFSFFNYIIINKKQHSKKELSMMLTHENVHSSQYHSLDILLSNLLLIVQWWNPMAWLYKKSMEENLEFIADTETIKKISCPKTYQYTLVKNTTTTVQPALATHFYQSLIKKRIIMLNKSASNSINRWKTILVLPLLALFLWSFNVREELNYVPTESTNPRLKITTKQHSDLKTLLTATKKSDTLKKNKQTTPLIIINGEISTKKILDALNSEAIKNIHVFKDETATNKYGSKGINGVIEIITKPIPSTIEVTHTVEAPSIPSKNTSLNNNRLKDPLYIIDGKEVSKQQFKNINNDNIKAVNVLKGKSATDKYGTKGENGVLEITLKKKEE